MRDFIVRYLLAASTKLALDILRACAVVEFYFEEERRKKSERVKTALVCWRMQKLITIEPANDGKHTLKPKQLFNLD